MKSRATIETHQSAAENQTHAVITSTVVTQEDVGMDRDVHPDRVLLGGGEVRTL